MSRQGVSPPLWQSRPPLGAPPMRPSGASVPLVPHLAILSQPSSARTQYQASPAMQFSASLQTILIGQLTMHYYCQTSIHQTVSAVESQAEGAAFSFVWQVCGLFTTGAGEASNWNSKKTRAILFTSCHINYCDYWFWQLFWWMLH